MDREKWIRYFAYGSNMFTARLQSRVPSARVYNAALLKGHELKFNKVGRDGSGKCSIHPTGQEGDAVYGVVFDIPLSEKPGLDRAEDLGIGYSETTVQVVALDGGQEMEAITYQAKANKIDDSLKPFDWYKQYVCRGAREHGLPRAWIESLEAVEAVEDTDADRSAREWGILKGRKKGYGGMEIVVR